MNARSDIKQAECRQAPLQKKAESLTSMVPVPFLCFSRKSVALISRSLFFTRFTCAACEAFSASNFVANTGPLCNRNKNKKKNMPEEDVHGCGGFARKTWQSLMAKNKEQWQDFALSVWYVLYSSTNAPWNKTVH